MSTAFLFLVVALAAAAAGSALMWYYTGRNRDQEPDYRDQLRAIAPDTSQGPIEQPRGIVTLDELSDEEH